MPTYRDVYLENDEARSQSSLEELLQRETEDEKHSASRTSTTSGDVARSRARRHPERKRGI
jgi:hypothetical protein